MRAIKFRAWDRVLKIMLIPKFISNGNNSCSSDLMAVQGNIDLLQFTGLIDATNVEIFEGDILRANDHNNQVCVVEYKGSGFWAKEKDGFNGDVEGWINYDTQVIGNIYQNPELMEGVK